MRALCVVVGLLVPVVPVVAAAGPSPNAGKKQMIDSVVAIVNDAVILRSELDQRLAPLRDQAAAISDPKERERRLAKLTPQLLDEMINDELMLQAAHDAHLTVDKSDIQATLDYLKKEHKLDDKQLEQAMRDQGITVASLEKDILRQRAVSQLVAPKITVSDEDVRGRYAELQRRANIVIAVNISQIVFALPEHPTEQQLADAKAKAQRAIDRVKAGEEFAKVATELTDDASTKATGGMLGWIDPKTVNADWEPVLFGMDKGEVRGPLQGPSGLHVFYANEIKRDELKSFDEMKPQLTEELRRRALAKQTQAWIEELRKKAYIEIKLK
ncbi:MAG TPA: peptidylprolyl isomerase [Kofleriaceae bacterium]|nr:peptidylprolyl isomerase [Kofleriaceae bacterium]